MNAKKSISAIIVAITMLAMPFSAQAQFGNLLKKANKAISKVNNVLSNNQTNAQSTDGSTPQAKAIVQTNGVEVMNPLSECVDIELVGFYGKSTSVNYGEGYVVFKIKMKANANEIGIGGNGDGGAIAIDQDGNTYKWGQGINSSYNVAEGIASKVVVKGQYQKFEDLKKSATTMQLIRMNFHIDANHRGDVIFKNVPVLWDQEFE